MCDRALCATFLCLLCDTLVLQKAHERTIGRATAVASRPCGLLIACGWQKTRRLPIVLHTARQASSVKPAHSGHSKQLSIREVDINAVLSAEIQHSRSYLHS